MACQLISTMTRPLFQKLTLAATLFSSVQLTAQTFPSAVSSAEEDFKKAVAELSVVTGQIAQEKLPLTKQLLGIEEEVRSKRKEAQQAIRLQGNKSVNLDALKTRVDRRNKEVGYIGGLLGEYATAFGSRIQIAEDQLYRTALTNASQVVDDVNLGQAQKLEQQVKLLQTGLDRLTKVLGGDTFEGQALAPSGNLETGKFAIFGPIAIFASSDTDVTGVVDIRANSKAPVVFPIDPIFSPAIKTVTSTGAGTLPVDSTRGNAIKIAATRETWFEHVQKGGPVMIPILTLAALAALIGFVKWLQLTGIRKARLDDLQSILDSLRKGEKEPALQRAKSIRGPAGDLLTAAVNHSSESREIIEEVLYERMLTNKPKLERMMPFIALTAATAPLLGLLGTVTGMINTFKMITVFGTGDPKLLSAGISEALITTEYGLIVAVPCLLLHALLSRKAKGVLASMEQTTVGFINGLPHKA